DQVVVDEGRHVHELHCHTGGHGRGPPGRGREEREQRAQTLAPGAERVPRDGGDDPAVRAHGLLQALFELLEVEVEARCVADGCEGVGHAAFPVCSATIPPANVRYATSSKPAALMSSAS